ncbi:flippase [Pedobacter alluvionis]|uniref:Flippase n=1 Tax=Pedobacter alluvionis TaxID=475253 RepID=A0A497Y2I8_9SPHI|nr:flippase [Pedobacter alluvionis]RLJ73891.1 O-antigen/teichoic acid export membrane protein [Pedobacter alluvionis]TFB32502.1 flippase [Pedobacter alluvionis]
MKEKIAAYLKLDTSKNAFWLFLDKIIRLGIGMIVGILVARYLGPELFGRWNYVIACIALVSAFATLGLDQIIVKYLLDKKLDEFTLLGTAFYLRLFGSFISTLIIAFYFYFFKNENKLLFIALLTVSNLWFQSTDVIDLKNQSILRSKKTVIVKNIVFILTSIIRVLLVYYKASLMIFVIVASLEYVLAALGMVLYYGASKVFNWKFDLSYCKILLLEAWPLILSGIIIMMYMRLDQVMIGNILGEESTGLYSVSTRFTELWYFIPSVFVTSFFPRLVEKFKMDKNEYLKLSLKLFKLLFFISLSISLFFLFSAEIIIETLYGKGYVMAIPSLQISIWTGIFVFWGVAAGNMLVIENLNKHNLIKSVQGLVLNIILNFILIPRYGINGAAIATLISQFYASYLYYILFKKTRHIFLLQTKSILFV